MGAPRQLKRLRPEPWGVGAALAERGGQLFLLKTATAVLALLAVVNLGFWVHNRWTRSSPAVGDAEPQVGGTLKP